MEIAIPAITEGQGSLRRKLDGTQNVKHSIELSTGVPSS